jgi:hypothetical protein
MSWNELLNRTLTQARELQHAAAEAVNRTTEDLKPHVEQSIKQAQALQETLAHHAAESGAATAEQTQAMVGHLGEYMRMGQEAMRESAEKARAAAVGMTEQAKKVVDAAAAAMERKPE